MDAEAPVPPFAKLMSPEQWARVAEAIALVQASRSGFGEVRLVFEDGHPAMLHTTVAATFKDAAQVDMAIQRVYVAESAGGSGSVSVIVRNGHPSRIEVTTSEVVPMPLDARPPQRRSTV